MARPTISLLKRFEALYMMTIVAIANYFRKPKFINNIKKNIKHPCCVEKNMTACKLFVISQCLIDSAVRDTNNNILNIRIWQRCIEKGNR